IMKRLSVLALLILLLTACGDDGATVPVSSQPDQTEQDDRTEEQKQQDLEAAEENLKAEAIEGSFIELNAGEVSKETKLKLTGIAKFVQGTGTNQTFTLNTDEGDGFGVYQVKNYIATNVEEDTEVTVYGFYNGKSELGSPEIIAILIE